MGDMPERIKAWTWNNHTYSGQWHVNGLGKTTEYVRGDLFDAVKAERDNYKALYEAERDDELLNIARQAGYQDGAEDRRKLEARVKALAEALLWCSGSSDFNEGGQARDGWLKLCAPLIKVSKQK